MKDSTGSRDHAWWRLIATAVSRHALLKALGTPISIAMFFLAYFFLLKHPFFPATIMPVTWIDRMTSFQPMALPLYVSLWLYVSLPPALLATRREVLSYGLAIGVTCVIGLLIFCFWPTAVPTVHVDWTLHPNVSFLKNIDASGNACPSMHVVAAVFSGISLHHLLRRFGSPVWLLTINVLWCAGIVYSTLATRQHVAVDVLAGLVLGTVAAGLALRLGVFSGDRSPSL